MKKLNNLIKSQKERKQFSTGNREVFYELAKKYLPKNPKDIIIDIGAGGGKNFISYLKLDEKYKNTYLLDANPKTIKKIKKNRKNALFYLAPEKLPFNDNSVFLIHCSHMVEHLTIKKLKYFLKEIDRVLMKNGIIIISTPLLNNNFYSDRSHIRPYNPAVFLKFLCKNNLHSPTYNSISQNYILEDLTYRYRIKKHEEGYGADYLIIDLIIKFFKIVLHKLGIKSYIKNGYTIILRKS